MKEAAASAPRLHRAIRQVGGSLRARLCRREGQNEDHSLRPALVVECGEWVLGVLADFEDHPVCGLLLTPEPEPLLVS